MSVTLSDIIASLSLLLSIIATWESTKYKKLERELLEQQKKLNELILEKEQREARLAESADLGASMVRLGSSRHRLRVYNRGPATAYNVKIDFPEGNDVVIEADLHEKFPLETMEPGQSVELVAAVAMETRRKLAVRLSWENQEGTPSEKTIYVTF